MQQIENNAKYPAGLSRNQQPPDRREGFNPVTPEDTLVVRESRTTVVVALLICAALAGMGTLSFGGPFQFAAVGFMILTAFFISIVLWSAAFVTVLTPEGLQIRHFGRGRNYSWVEIEAWGLEYDPNGEFSIWFTPGGARKRRYIQAAGEDMKVRVREYFRRYCGSPQTKEQT
jgi:hypothetical protein